MASSNVLDGLIKVLLDGLRRLHALGRALAAGRRMRLVLFGVVLAVVALLVGWRLLLLELVEVLLDDDGVGEATLEEGVARRLARDDGAQQRVDLDLLLARLLERGGGPLHGLDEKRLSRDHGLLQLLHLLAREVVVELGAVALLAEHILLEPLQVGGEAVDVRDDELALARVRGGLGVREELVETADGEDEKGRRRECEEDFDDAVGDLALPRVPRGEEEPQYLEPVGVGVAQVDRVRAHRHEVHEKPNDDGAGEHPKVPLEQHDHAVARGGVDEGHRDGIPHDGRLRHKVAQLERGIAARGPRGVVQPAAPRGRVVVRLVVRVGEALVAHRDLGGLGVVGLLELGVPVAGVRADRHLGYGVVQLVDV
mmetsp:Transcript_68656/g.188312  ORF Transcript_68656/g.188312 Transcript_68656/m.188312 type:complete len:369 (-) Transcript_68656:3604-4710(-)